MRSFPASVPALIAISAAPTVIPAGISGAAGVFSGGGSTSAA
jgi:hypothetical protein